MDRMRKWWRNARWFGLRSIVATIPVTTVWLCFANVWPACAYMDGEKALVPQLAHSISVTAVGSSQDGHLIVAGNADGSLNLWDAAKGHRLRTFRGHSDWVTSVAISPDGHTIVSASDDKTLKLWDALSGRELFTLTGHSSAVLAVAFSPDGRKIASGSNDKTVKLWDSINGHELRTMSGHLGPVRAIAFSPNGRTIVSASDDKTLKLWDVPTGSELRTLSGHSGSVRVVAFSSNGREIVSGSWDNTIKWWDSKRGSVLVTHAWFSGSDGALAFSPDGREIIRGEPFFSAVSDLTQAVAFSPSPAGHRIVSGSTNGAVKLWDIAGGEYRLVLSMVSFDDGEWVAVTPEGFFDASEGGAKFLSVVGGPSSYSLDQIYDALHRPDLVREKLAGDPSGKVRDAAAKLDLSKAIASGNAPRVSIVSPGLQTTEQQVSVEASISDQGGGVGKIEWRVNGMTQGVEPPSADTFSSKTVTVKKTLTLEPGDNRIEIVAYNAQGLIASDPAQVIVTLQSGAAAAPPRLYVLAVGVNDYWDSRLRLAFAVPDAQALGDAMRKAGQNLYERVEVTLALDAQATAPALEATFNDLAQKVRPQDAFVFFLSGHGKTVDGRFYFIPQDFHYAGEDSIVAKGIGQDQLQKWFAQIQARKSVLLFDACESGSLTEDQNKAVGRGLEELTAIDRLTRAMGRTVLTATTDDKPAAEGVGGHGVFTYALLKAIGEAQADSDGLIGVTELASYVDRSVPELSYAAWKIRQVPQMRIIGSNFPIVRKISVLTEEGAQTELSIPVKPTHVVIATAAVHSTASESTPTVVELSAGTQVRLVEASGEWVLVAREGKRLGYVQANALLGLQ
jgi:WD40 repeat protein